jgi:hypothetical protein
MTKEERVDRFFRFHGRSFDYLKRSDMFIDLMDVLRSFDPARAMPDVQAKDSTEHSQHLLGRITGFNLALQALETLARPAEEQIPQESFEEQPV